MSIPFTILTGFLGSGKTTLLNRVLHELHGVRYAVIVNEFGAIGLDDQMLPQNGQSFVKMDNGCLCCALNEDLETTLSDLLQNAEFDAVILETTGVADPLPIAWVFSREQFAGRFRFAGIVTVVDGLNWQKNLDEFSEVRLQIERADLMYVSKIARQDCNVAGLQNINPRAPIFFAEDADVIKLLFEPKEFLLKPLVATHHHDQSYASVSIDIPQSKTLEDIEDFFETLPPAVIRAKAILNDAAKSKWFAIHAVSGRVDFVEIAAPDEKRSALVLIGRKQDEMRLRDQAALISQPGNTKTAG